MAGNTVVISITSNVKGLKNGIDQSTSLLGGLGKVAGVATKTVLGIGAALGGLAIAGGISRAIGIDEATTKLKALGYSGSQVSGIMDSALASVKGTAFGLNDAATVAANALASGIKPGDQLTSVLTTVANTAALAGTGMGDMGAIFNKVTANGKVSTDDMQQLADRGVPAFQYLAKSIGVTVPELQKMISAGQVSSDMFLNAMGPAVDGVANTMGGSFLGSLRNAQASLSRLGAAFVAPTLPVLTAGLAQFMKIVDAGTAALKPLTDRFAAWLGTIDVSGVGDSVIAFFSKVVAEAPGFINFLTQVSPMSALFKALVPVLGQLTPLWDALVAVVQAFAPELGTLATLIGGVLNDAAVALVGLLTLLLPLITGILNFIADNADAVTALAVAVGVVVAGFQLWQTALAAFEVATKAAAVVQAAFNAVMDANPISIIIIAIAALVAGLIYFFTQTKTGQAIWASFTSFLSEAWQNTVNFIKGVINGLVSFFTTAWTTIKNGVVAGWNAVMSFFNAIPGAVKAVFSAAVSWLVSGGRNIITGLKNGIDAAWSAVTGFFGGIGSWIGGVFSGAYNWLVQAGKNILGGFFDGLKSAWTKVTDFVGGIGDWIVQHKGPPAYDKTLLVNAGQLIMGGLQAGLESKLPALKKTLQSVSDTIAGTSMTATVDYAVGSSLTSSPVLSASTSDTAVYLSDASVDRLASAVAKAIATADVTASIDEDNADRFMDSLKRALVAVRTQDATNARLASRQGLSVIG